MTEGPEAGHLFEFTMRSRGSFQAFETGEYAEADWWSDPATVQVRAWDLPAALEKAKALSLADWYPEEDDEER